MESLDDALQSIMDRVEAGEADAIEEWRRLIEKRDSRFIAAVGQRLWRVRQQMQQTNDTYAQLLDEYRAAMQPMLHRAGALERTLEEAALAFRRETGATTLNVPHIGKVTTRKSPGRPSIVDAEAVRAFLTGSEREAYLEPQPDRVKAREVLADIKQIAEAHGISDRDIPGIQWGDDEIKAKVED